MGRIKIITGILLLFSLIMVQTNSPAQELIFEKQLDSLQKHPNFGPNRRHFCHAFLSSSLFFSPSSGTEIKTRQPFTGQIALGFRYKLKINRPLSVITECGLNRSFFKLDQSPGKNFPDTLIHHSQSLRSTAIFGGVFFRIRLGQRGDYLGNFIDLGLVAQTSMSNKLVTRDEINSMDPKPYLIDKTTVSRLMGINPLNYKASVRVGFDRFSLFATYRLSRLVDTSSGKDLPAMEVGFEISPVSY